jgi:hypothetical protein
MSETHEDRVSFWADQPKSWPITTYDDAIILKVVVLLQFQAS